MKVQVMTYALLLQEVVHKSYETGPQKHGDQREELESTNRSWHSDADEGLFITDRE
jgi:hypothetical protein